MQTPLLSAAVLLSSVLSTLSARTDMDGAPAEIIEEDNDDHLSPLKPYHVVHECVNTTSADGVFYIKSVGREETCGLYLFSDATQTIEIHVEYVNVPCHTGGLIAFVDGWEMNGQLFPSPEDHAVPVNERYLQYCGQTAARQIIRSSQNVALLQYRLPVAGSAVSVHVRHVSNPKPCNQLVESASLYTLRNFGQRRNCTLLSMSPVEYQLVSFSVGVPGRSVYRQTRTGTLHRCAKRGWRDYLEVGETAGLDTSAAVITARLCGSSVKAGPTQTACSAMFVTRLVSSGLYDNQVVVHARTLSPDQLIAACFANFNVDFDPATLYDW